LEACNAWMQALGILCGIVFIWNGASWSLGEYGLKKIHLWECEANGSYLISIQFNVHFFFNNVFLNIIVAFHCLLSSFNSYMHSILFYYSINLTSIYALRLVFSFHFFIFFFFFLLCQGKEEYSVANFLFSIKFFCQVFFFFFS
jgi:hypothetical protein